MADTEFGTGSDQAVRRWSQQLMKETFEKMDLKSLIGRESTSVIQLKTELSKDAGDRISYDLLAQDRSDGVNGDSTLEGFETPLTFFQDDLRINLKRHAHSFRGMSQQRTVHDLRAASRFSLSNWWAWFIQGGLFAHLSGVPGDGAETVIGALGGDTGGSDWAGNSIVDIDAGHLVDAGSNTMTLSYIDDAIAKAKVQNPRVAPAMIGGREKYIMYIHPYQTRSLRSDTGAGGWNDIHKEASARGSENPIYTGALGEYNNVILRESEMITSSGDFHNAILLGSGAACIAMGNAWDLTGGESGGKGSYFNWREQPRDYGNKKGVAGISCLGFKRTQFDSKAYGCMVVRTEDAAP